ncbi:ShlB/FhaC/HecB family hemolysin secretion/activation protein [Pseudooceanicola sp. MF1-13]|uniref:ShlB/FhaC/HecB family hemolysin secretion/activation protein n=1 Tax=Pseudooceanicola sp. MF1-13 TaxID=3379095 RepID=UPI0038914957
MLTASRPFALFLAVPLFLAAAAHAQSVDLNAADAVDTQVETQTETPQTADEAGQAAAAAETAGEAADTTPTQTAPSKQRTAAKPQPRRAPQGVLIRDVVYSGPSSYLSESELAKIEAGLVGRRYSNAGLALIPQAINQAYAEKGIVTAQAILRSVAGGRAEVELLEARIGAVRASGGLVSDDYARFRLQLPAGTLADNRVISTRVEQLALTENLPLDIGYAPGQAYGTTDLTVAFPPQKRHFTSVTVDNYGSASSGEAQMTIAHTVRSLTGWNDPLSLSVLLRKGATGGTISYARTITPSGGFISLVGAYTKSKSITGPNIRGEQKSLDMAFTQPLVVERAYRTSLGFGLTAFAETSSLLGVQTLNHRGTELSLNASYYRAGEGWSVTYAPRAIFGTYDDAVTPRANISYAAAQVNLFASVALGADAVGSVTASGQKRGWGVLPSQRKFTVTSPAGVRGYPTNLSSGDSGYYARTQVEKLTPYAISGDFGLRPFAFYDMGEAYDSTDTGLGFASSVGIGASFGVGNTAFGDVYVAKPLTTGITGWAAPSRAPVFGASVSITF